MRVDFEKIEIPGLELWAASVDDYHINITKSHNNLAALAYVFEIAPGDGMFTDIIAKGFGPDVEIAAHRAVAKIREMKLAAAKVEEVTAATDDNENLLQEI